MGNNDSGQLGNSQQNAGLDTITLIDNNPNLWQQVTATNKRSYAIINGGYLMAWGSGANGWLGMGAISTNFATPTVVQSANTSGWSKLAVGSGGDHMLAIATDGSLWAWGSNNHGQLGLGDTQDRYVPTLVDDTNSWIYVAIGRDFTIAVRDDNTVWGCGDNSYFQLGQVGDTNDKLVLTRILVTDSSEKIIVEVAAGESSAIAIDSVGSLYGWGGNTYGELGVNSTQSAQTSVPIPLVLNEPILHAAISRQAVVIQVITT